MTEYTFKCLECKATKVVNRSMTDDDAVTCDKCGAVMERDYKADFGKQGACDTYPMASYAAGASPSEVPGLRKIDAENGVPTDYNSEADPIFVSPAHRKKYCEVHNLFDRNAGYSDPVPARCR